MKPTRLVLLLAALLALHSTVTRADPSPAGPAVPSALSWGRDGFLRVALREARTVAVVDTKCGVVVARHLIPFRPVSLTGLGQGEDCLVGGTEGEVGRLSQGGEFIPLRPANGRGHTRTLDLGSGQVLAASRWDDSLRVIDRNSGKVTRSIPIGFPPGALVKEVAGRFLVADAFGSRIARVDSGTGEVRTLEVDGVNLKGLSVASGGRELLFVHLSQYQPAPVTAANIDWGLVLSAGLTSVLLDEFERPEGAPLLSRFRLTLDGSKNGAADPSALAVSHDGREIFVAVAGAHQVLRTRRGPDPRSSDPAGRAGLGESQDLDAREVGQMPVALALDPTGRRLVTADAMSDTLTVLRTADLSVETVIAVGPGPGGRTAVQRGEAIFHDARRSMDRWLSCSSCHTDGHSTGLNFDTLGDGAYGASKNTPSLLGVAGTAPYGWTGRFESLAEQAHQSIVSSMKGPPPGPADVQDLVAYLRTLRPPPPRRAPDERLALRGSEVFKARRCVTCHKGPDLTVAGLRDVGLDDGPGGHDAFNPPSLLGVGWSAPYLHDGRAPTLGNVLDVHHPTFDTPVSGPDRDALLAFLRSL